MAAQEQLAPRPFDSPTPSHLPVEDEAHTTIIRATDGWAALNLGEVWSYRDLLYFLIWREIKVRYKQTVFGGAWAILQPLLTMALFTIVFSRLAGLSSDGIPYPLFTYCALVPWTYFSNALSQASNSLVAQERLITKVYFPRVLVPMAPVFAGLLDFAIAFTVLAGLQAYYGVRPAVAILALPAFILLAVVTVLGVGLWLSALNVRYRDVRYTIPFLIQIWLFATPIAYSSSLVPERWRLFLGINPMTGVVDGFRWALFGAGERPGSMLLVSVVVAGCILVGGLYYFRQAEQSFADVV